MFKGKLGEIGLFLPNLFSGQLVGVGKKIRKESEDQPESLQTI
jgi:hypothetical protein